MWGLATAFYLIANTSKTVISCFAFTEVKVLQCGGIDDRGTYLATWYSCLYIYDGIVRLIAFNCSLIFSDMFFCCSGEVFHVFHFLV